VRRSFSESCKFLAISRYKIATKNFSRRDGGGGSGSHRPHLTFCYTVGFFWRCSFIPPDIPPFAPIDRFHRRRQSKSPSDLAGQLPNRSTKLDARSVFRNELFRPKKFIIGRGGSPRSPTRGEQSRPAAAGRRLAAIPVLDVRDGGPARHAAEGRVRARALRDECVGWLPRLAARSLRSRAPHATKYTAGATELGFPGNWFLNGWHR
jgi:hypothetical protein